MDCKNSFPTDLLSNSLIKSWGFIFYFIGILITRFNFLLLKELYIALSQFLTLLDTIFNRLLQQSAEGIE